MSVMANILSQEDDDVGLYFVPKDSTERESLMEAYQAAVNYDLTPEWLSEEECIKMTPTKRNVFVFQSFDGSAFIHLQTFKCVSLIGPRCLLSCMRRHEQLPLSRQPMFTAAMRGLQISASGIGADLKKELRKKVEMMAGTYTQNLFNSTTHLVVSSVISAKYEKALTRGIKVYVVGWVECVWKKSLEDDVHASDQQFEVLKCPPFLGLEVCSSNFATNTAKRIKQLVSENGGTYSSSLNLQTTDILVVRGNSSAKFKHARQWNKPCVTIEWINDCVGEGHALPTKPYEVVGNSASSPKSGCTGADGFLETFDISHIPMDNKTHIDESVMDSTTSSVAFCPDRTTPVKTSRKANLKTPVKACVPKPGDVKHLLESLDVSKTKAAGAFLDGCGVLLSGWSTEEEEKLKRVLKSSGAARFGELCDRVSHILVGELDKSLTRTLKSIAFRPCVVTIQWLIASISQKSPAQGDLYACLPTGPSATTEAPSPLSKKGMAILQQGTVSPDRDETTNHGNDDQDQGSRLPESELLLKKYQNADSSTVSDLSTIQLKPVGSLSNSAAVMPPPPPPPQPTLEPKEVTSSCASQEEETMVFKGLKFLLAGLSDDEAVFIENNLIKAYGGDIVPQTYKGVLDYAIVPLTGTTLRHTASEIVTAHWVEDCISSQQLLPVEYYHQPVVVDTEKQPLRGCVLGISGYNGKARQFIPELAVTLGAIVQEVFVRKVKRDKLASTHLICSTTENSSKFDAAIKWGLPAVSHEWLLMCAATGKRVSFRPYLLDPEQQINDNSLCDNSSRTNPEYLSSPQVAALRTAESRDNSATTPLHHNPADLQRLITEPLPPNPYVIKTPEEPIGLSANPSPGERKRFIKWINSFPDPLPKEKPPPQRQSTPLNELRRRFICQAKRNIDAMSGDAEGCQSSSGSTGLAKDVGEGLPKSPTDGRLDKLQKLIDTPDPDEVRPNASKRTLFKHLPDDRKPPPSDILEEGSQPYSIKWEDPVNLNKVAKEGLASPLKETDVKKKRKSSSSGEDAPAMKLPNRASDIEKKFLLSHVESKDHLASIINGLKGRFVDTATFDSSATHLVLDRPGRSEKLLSAIASGLWILHTSYLLESHEKKSFLQEGLFEWGSPKAPHLDKLLNSGVERALAAAAHRWRETLAKSERRGAFEGMRYVILSADDKRPAFIRLVTAGGGTIVEPKNAVKSDVCCIDSSKVQVDFEDYAKREIVCVPLVYLHEFLTLDPPPSPESRAFEEYKKIRNRVKRK